MTTSGMGSPWDQAEDMTSERAADYFVRRRGGDWSDADQLELDAWLTESTLHEAAYLRVEGIAARADHLAAIRALKLRQAATLDSNKFDYRKYLVPLLAAASVALAATFGGRFVAYLMQPPDSMQSTDVGGRALLTYGDHTQIELNTNTTVRVRMTTAERTVWLEKGEAWFHVSHDARHPFRVFVGGHRITDLGTDFLVRRDANDVSVTLLKGSVTLSGGSPQNATLSPGDEAIATPASISVTRRTPQELQDALAWRRGTLVFRKAKLADVVREFNRYNTTRIVIADPSIASETISADLKADDFEGFLHLAEDGLKLRVDRGGSVILISRGQQKETKRSVHSKHRP